jgi:CubicO group peptidase (beta-lactamase class C family)
MVLAGTVIERASGMSHYDYVRRNVYQRAGMNNSDSYWKDEDTPNLARAYTGREGSLRYNYDSRPMRGSPAAAATRPARTYCASPPRSPATSCSTPSTPSC